MSQTYCQAAPGDPVHDSYHATEYGFPVADESALFERLVLEINQAGLSWATILRKRENFRKAYAGFDVDTVAGFGSATPLSGSWRTSRRSGPSRSLMKR